MEKVHRDATTEGNEEAQRNHYCVWNRSDDAPSGLHIQTFGKMRPQPCTECTQSALCALNQNNLVELLRQETQQTRVHAVGVHNAPTLLSDQSLYEFHRYGTDTLLSWMHGARLVDQPWREALHKVAEFENKSRPSRTETCARRQLLLTMTPGTKFLEPETEGKFSVNNGFTIRVIGYHMTDDYVPIFYVVLVVGTAATKEHYYDVAFHSNHPGQIDFQKHYDAVQQNIKTQSQRFPVISRFV